MCFELISQKDQEEVKQVEEEDKDEEPANDKQEEVSDDSEPDLWEETFKSHTDSKPKGWNFEDRIMPHFTFSFFTRSSNPLYVHPIITHTFILVIFSTGPTSVGLDVTFTDFEHVFGIPEHADSFALKSTKSVFYSCSSWG